jgi:ligand-binding SRPBCC domain-containing protein
MPNALSRTRGPVTLQTIRIETKIAAPPERCFLLSLNIDLHLASTSHTREQAIVGTTHGLIGLGETVTWQGRHFGLMLKHQSLITQYDEPRYFQDVMLKGMFRSFQHDHFFESHTTSETTMRDDLCFTAPLGPLGYIAETLVLRRYLTRFLVDRNEIIRRVAEGPESIWSPFLQRH